MPARNLTTPASRYLFQATAFCFAPILFLFSCLASRAEFQICRSAAGKGSGSGLPGFPEAGIKQNPQPVAFSRQPT